MMAESSEITTSGSESSSNANEYSAEEKADAKETTSLFRKNNNDSKANYDACLTILKRLLTTRPNDPKVLLNKAVVEYLKSDYKATEEFHQQLVACAQLTGLPLEKADKLDDVDQVVIFYNYALVLYYQRQYRKADAIISRTVPFSEPLEEYFSRRQSLLYMEVLLKLQEVDRVLKHCSSVEKALAHVQEGAGQDNYAENIRNDKFKSEVILYKIKALLMNRSMKQAKKEIKQLFGSGLVTQPILFLKAYFEFLRRNSRKAVKIIGSVPDSMKNPVDMGESDSVMHWNNLGCLHLQMGKHNLSVLYFRKAMKENEKVCQEFQPKKLNSKGNQYTHHHQPPLKAYSISCHYQLILNTGIGLLFSGKPLAAFEYLLEVINIYSRNPRLWLRLAECCIKAHRASNDVDRDLDARMRAIEKTVGSGVHRKIVLGSSVNVVKKPWEESAAMPTPTLEFASLCVRNALQLLPKEPEPNRSSGAQEPEDETRRILRWAEELRIPLQPAGFLRGTEILCLRNSILTAGAYIALCLSDYLGAVNFTEQLLQQPCLTGAQRYLGRMYRAEANVYMDHIADALSLLNADTVDSVSVTVESEPNSNAATQSGVSGSNEESNNAGGGEGSRSGIEGGAHGDEQAGQNSTMGSDVESSCVSLRWEPSTLTKARGLMTYNMATAYAIREEYTKARPLLNKAVQPTGMPLPAQFYFLRLYLDLMLGDRANAQVIIKDVFGHLSINQRQFFGRNRGVIPNYHANSSE